MNATLTTAQKNLLKNIWGYTSFTDRKVGKALVAKGLATCTITTGRRSANSALCSQAEYTLNDAGIAAQKAAFV
jgi:hypothetical protein